MDRVASCVEQLSEDGGEFTHIEGFLAIVGCKSDRNGALPRAKSQHRLA